MPIFYISCIKFFFLTVVTAIATFFPRLLRWFRRNWTSFTIASLNIFNKKPIPYFCGTFFVWIPNTIILFSFIRSFASALDKYTCKSYTLFGLPHRIHQRTHVFKYRLAFYSQYYTEKSNLFPRTKWNCALYLSSAIESKARIHCHQELPKIGTVSLQ